jgi:nitrate/nitrite transport system ATP-binding protein
VDEAILLADKILLMSNGPRARIAEVVRNTMPRDRTRLTMHHDPQYYRIRNHLIDFLVTRSKAVQAAACDEAPVEVTPGLDEPAAPTVHAAPPLARVA